MPELIAALADFAVLGQDTLHRANRADVPALVEERGEHLCRGQIAEARFVQQIEHGRALLGAPRARRAARLARAVDRVLAAVVAGARKAERVA
jgi:hypothetical protein